MQQQEITGLVEFLLRVPQAGFANGRDRLSILSGERNDEGCDLMSRPDLGLEYFQYTLGWFDRRQC
jgi:hypothetical protein